MLPAGSGAADSSEHGIWPIRGEVTSLGAAGGEQKEQDRQLDSFRRDDGQYLTTNRGLRINHTDDSLKAGPRGPTLMEDFHFREKMTHFDHESIPERVVHARGSGAHGFFQPYESMAKYTRAKFLADPSVKTPVFVRFSTVVGSRDSSDTVRDVRGFATKIWPEADVPLMKVGKMTLNRNPDNFFAETEQVAFHPGHVVPGIDLTNDPLLQGRLFSYLDTQLNRFNSANFHEVPINRPVAPVHNNQGAGFMRMTIGKGKVNYFPNSLGGGYPQPAPEEEGGYVHYMEKVEGRRVRERSESFKDHFSQATMFWHSIAEPEQFIAALAEHRHWGRTQKEMVPA